MNIQDYLYAIRRRLWLPIALPLLALLITGGIIYLQPASYQATATVIVPSLSAKGYSTSAVTQYVSTYKDVLISAPVVNQVSASTGVRVNDLVNGLSADTATASSNIIVVTYTGPAKAKSEEVVKTAAIDSLDALMAPQLASAEAEVAASKQAVDTANSKIQDFTAQSGLLLPDEDYRLKSAELSSLLVQLEQAQLAGDSSRANGLQTIITTRQKELTDLAPQVVAYQQLVDNKTAAIGAYNKAQTDLTQVNAQIASDHAPGSVVVRNLGKVSRLSDALKFGGVALAVALLLSLGFILLMEYLRPARPVLAIGAHDEAKKMDTNGNGHGALPASDSVLVGSGAETAESN